MNSVLICIALAILAQGWERPEMEATELAAPPAMQVQQEQPKQLSEDLDSTAPTPQPAPTPVQQPAQNNSRWEYDENGQPVVRGNEEKVQTNTPVPTEAVPVKKEEKKEPAKKNSNAGRIATFWFIMPPR